VASAPSLDLAEVPSSDRDEDELVVVRHLVKTYPGVVALSDVSLTIRRGTVHALLGENGAGKSTLINILSGVTRPDSGEVIVEGNHVSISSPKRSQELGISTIHQELSLAPDLTVLENIFLGRELQTRILGVPIRLDERRMERRVLDLSHEFGFSEAELSRPVSEFGALKQHVVEILKALAFDSKLVILDEPTSGLADHERLTLFDQMRALRARGIAVLWVTHRLDEVYGLTDDISVLRDGRYIATVSPEDTDAEALVRLMVGRETHSVGDLAARPEPPAGHDEGQRTEVLRVERVSNLPAVQEASFTLYRGEVLGIAGIAGAGRTELARIILGADRTPTGQVFVDGKPLRLRTPRDAYRNGMALVPEERKVLGIIGDFTVSKNISIADLPRICWGRLVLNRRKEDKVGRDFVKDLRVKTSSVAEKIRNLSGGNQQKVIIARCLFTRPKVLIFDEPTQGIDVGAKEEVYRLIYQFVDDGGAAIVISSELPELLRVSDRVLVMREGRIAGEVSTGSRVQAELDRKAEEIMALATREGAA
jgi:ribose transport system ATP-binding protein